MIDDIKQWIADYNLDVQWSSVNVFRLDGKDYLCLEHKAHNIFDPEFNLILSEAEQNEILIDYYCFSFGGKVYRSPVNSDKVQLDVLKHIGKAKELTGFPYLGVHGGYELCNGSRIYDDWCKKAKWLGIDTLGICERNTLAGLLKFQLACKDHSITSIIGQTITVKNNDDYYPVKVFVKDQQGWDSLLALNKLINVDNPSQYINEEDFIVLSEGLVVVIGEAMLTDNMVSIYTLALHQDVYFQIDPSQYKLVERDLKKLAVYKNYITKYLDYIPPIVICDSYYLDKQDNHIKKILNNIGGGFENQTEDQSFKSLEQVVEELDEMFSTLDSITKDKIITQALNNIYSVVDQLKFKIELGSLKLPQYTMTEIESQTYKNNDDLLWGLLNEGLQRKIVDKGKNLDVYIERLQTEMEVIGKGQFENYFLILSDIIRWCKQQNILLGLGRGSASGSLTSYLLDITKLDPIEYDLAFSRFLNEGRLGKSLPDIDTDTQGSRRGEIKRYIEQRHGVDNVCSIGTYGAFKTKAALRDLCRLGGVPPHVVDYYGAMISESGDDIVALFYDGVQTPMLKTFLKDNAHYINDIELILSQPKNASVHAAGIIITPSSNGQTIYGYMPVKKMDGLLVSEWEGPELEKAGYLKMDILGIKQLDKFADIFALIKQRGQTPPEFEGIDYNDKDVLELFKKGWNQDLFHFGSSGLTSYSQDIKPDNIEDLIAMIALYRPGVMEVGAHEQYVKIKRGDKAPEYDWGMEEVTKKTHSILVYQEQIMQACQVLAGFTLAEGDDIRKAMGKKIQSEMDAYKDRFIQGAIDRGCPPHEAMKIWDKLEVFAGYGFNRSHAAAYAMTGYFCQYLKHYYPMEFWTVSLQYASEEEIPQRISEIRKFGQITIVPPDINKSDTKFTSDFDNNTIYWSLGKIKFAGDVAINIIIEERNKNGQFFSLKEFYNRVPKRSVNKRVVVNLILAGCFDQLYNIVNIVDRKKIVSELYSIVKEPMPDEYTSNSEFFWFSKQKEISRSGYFDYDKIVKLSHIPEIEEHYLAPDQIMSPDNVDNKVVVIGTLVEVGKRRSKKGEFARLIIDHNDERIEFTMWNEIWMEYRKLIDNSIGRAIVISGKVKGADRYRKFNTVHSTTQDRDGMSTIVEIF